MVHETCQTWCETITREFRSVTNCPVITMTVHRELSGIGFHKRAAAHKPNTVELGYNVIKGPKNSVVINKYHCIINTTILIIFDAIDKVSQKPMLL
jgi:hypothetical protein